MQNFQINNNSFSDIGINFEILILNTSFNFKFGNNHKLAIPS